jgi:hypothetical protein
MKKSIFLILLLLSQESLANIIDGNDLLLACGHIDNDLSPPAQYCIGYIGGALDDYALLVSEGNSKVCVPVGIPTTQLARIVLKYLNEHPDKLHYHGGELVILALSKSFPCSE